MGANRLFGGDRLGVRRPVSGGCLGKVGWWWVAVVGEQANLGSKMRKIRLV